MSLATRSAAALSVRLRSKAGREAGAEIGPKALRIILRELLFDGRPIPEWRRLAACRTHDPDLFFPSSPLGVAAAKQVCAECPVRASCLTDALAWETDRSRHGIAGGLTPTERRRLAATLVPPSTEQVGGASA
jgi:WhiB family redox-sensing transcriptional regulator